MTAGLKVQKIIDKDQILNKLYDAIREVSPFAVDVLTDSDRNTDRDICLIDLGINSIDYAQIAHIVMEKLNVDCPLDTFAKTNSINGVVDVLYRSCAG